MKANLIAVALVLLVLGACMRSTTMYRTESPQARDLAGRDMEYSKAMPASGPVGGFKPVATAPEEQGDRDLGKGADDEKLGNPQRWQDLATVDPQTGERHAAVVDNAFVSTAAPGGDASTFGLDVDSASYANCRRFISEMRRLPPPAAVRIEELVNTLAYTYPAPAPNADVPFRASTAVAACPWAPEHRLVRVALRARSIDAESRPSLNLVFLVDVSGSMSDANKLPLVRESLLLLAEQLTARDHLAIVTYAGHAGVLLPATAGDQQERIRIAIRSLTTGGSTNGAGGINLAYTEAGRGIAPGTVSRVMLCTDGDFNVGISDRGQLQALIERQRAGGVCLNAYGFGMGNYKDDTLETLADHGNGIYGYIDGIGEARRLFAREAMRQLVTVAKDAKVQVFFSPATVGAWRLLGYENRVLKREDFNDDRIDAGDIGAGHTVTALYEIVPAGAAMPVAGGGDANPFLATPAAAGDASTLLRLRLRWKDPGETESRLLEHDVPAAVSEMDADFRTAAAAAGFGMLLRHSPWRGACTWDLVARLAASGRGSDASGQRAEFARLIAGASSLR